MLLTRPNVHGARLFEDRTGGGWILAFPWSLRWKWLLPTPAASGTWQCVQWQQHHLLTQASSRKPDPQPAPLVLTEQRHQQSLARKLAKNANAYSIKCMCLKRKFVIWICMWAQRLPAPAPLMISPNEELGPHIAPPTIYIQEGLYLLWKLWGQEVLT